MTSTDFLQTKKWRDLSQFRAPDHGLNNLSRCHRRSMHAFLQSKVQRRRLYCIQDKGRGGGGGGKGTGGREGLEGDEEREEGVDRRAIKMSALHKMSRI